MAEISTHIFTAVKFLKQGKCIGVPTETVYGLAANALNVKAVVDIFKIKNRPDFDPLIVHCKDTPSAFHYATDIPDMAKTLADKFWPGPLTLVLKKSPEIPYEVTSGLDTVGLRVPNHSMLLELLHQIDFPLAAPSANPFGYVSPTSAEHVNASLGERIDFILDGGPCEKGIESTIIGFEGEIPIVYRLGSLSIDKIEKVTGKLKIQINSSSNPVSPGQVKMHYSPHKKVILTDFESMHFDSADNSCFITFNRKIPGTTLENCFVLSPNSSFEEAARHLFAALRKMDQSQFDVIYAEMLPNDDLGKAINDRLIRAAAK